MWFFPVASWSSLLGGVSSNRVFNGFKCFIINVPTIFFGGIPHLLNPFEQDVDLHNPTRSAASGDDNGIGGIGGPKIPNSIHDKAL